jgi:nitroimidazol reductase NimA-like FMN-containing flavoprotein (pyridoxamine 5'-phosphate oxidase superfamily)
MPEEFREMSRAECLDKLRHARVGRICVTWQALPAIIPVNFVYDHGIVFRTRTGGMLERTCRGNVVAFEIDELREDGTGGWSVLVVGVADSLVGSERVRALNLGLASALGDDTDHFVRITLGTLTGRVIGQSVAAVPS